MDDQSDQWDLGKSGITIATPTTMPIYRPYAHNSISIDNNSTPCHQSTIAVKINGLNTKKVRNQAHEEIDMLPSSALYCRYTRQAMFISKKAKRR
jgi:hypothetical protein